jgi:hypothetical protein
VRNTVVGWSQFVSTAGESKLISLFIHAQVIAIGVSGGLTTKGSLEMMSNATLSCLLKKKFGLQNRWVNFSQ